MNTNEKKQEESHVIQRLFSVLFHHPHCPKANRHHLGEVGIKSSQWVSSSYTLRSPLISISRAVHLPFPELFATRNREYPLGKCYHRQHRQVVHPRAGW